MLRPALMARRLVPHASSSQGAENRDHPQAICDLRFQQSWPSVCRPFLLMYKFQSLLWMTYALAVHPLSAEPAPVVTLESIGVRVRSQNPDLAAARLMIDEAMGRMRNTGRLENPELQVGPRYNATSAERGLEVAINQKFPVTNRLKLEKNLGATEVESARVEIREVENQLIGAARSAMVRVLAVRQRKDLLEQQSKLATELADFISAAAQRGESSALGAGQARLEASRWSTESRRLTAEERQAIGELKPLLGMQPGEPLHVSGSLPGLALPDGAHADKRPALEVARLAVIAAEQTAAVERTKRYGDLTAGVVAAAERNIDAPNSAEKEGIIGIQFSIPLPFWNNNEGNIEAAEARAERRRKEALALHRTILLEAEAARAEMVEWAKLAAEIDQSLLPQAGEQSGLAEQSWRAGQADLIAVFRSREQSLALAATRLDALQNFHLARVRYETAWGNP
jgi:outer membrane protein, heavy metal efflux system